MSDDGLSARLLGRNPSEGFDFTLFNEIDRFICRLVIFMQRFNFAGRVRRHDEKELLDFGPDTEKRV